MLLEIGPDRANCEAQTLGFGQVYDDGVKESESGRRAQKIIPLKTLRKDLLKIGDDLLEALAHCRGEALKPEVFIKSFEKSALISVDDVKGLLLVTQAVLQ